MNWPSFEAFLHMGGHGLYVWGSYGAVALALGAELLLLQRRDRRAKAHAAAARGAASAESRA